MAVKKMSHCMLDFETWGKKPGCSIRSIGAVVFDPLDWTVWKEFYLNVDDTIGKQDPSTVKWWSEQDQAAQAIFMDPALPRVSLQEAMKSFREFYKFFECHAIWSHGSVFDVPIAEWCMDQTWVAHPWNFQSIRDTRTLFALCKGIKPIPHKHYTIKHHALHDAANQAYAVTEAYAQLGLLIK